MRTAPLAALTLAIAATAVMAQQPTRPPRDVGRPTRAAVATASIAGRVTSAESGAPVRRAEVVIANLERLPEPFATITDDDGRYEMRDLPAGNWQITVTKAGYASQQFGQRRPFEPPQTLPLADG